MIKNTAFAPLMFVGSAVAADGFGQMDVTQINIDPQMFKGGTMELGAAQDRATVFCTDCAEMVVLDVQFSRSNDGTEGRFRSGETTVPDMEAICKSRDPSCTLARVDVGPAAGLITIYGTNSTVVLFRDSDVLTLRSISDDTPRSLANARQAINTIAPQIVGN